MDIRKLQRVIVDALEDVKAQNIVVFNTEHLSALFERVIVASGTSSRQTKSLASSVREAVKTAGCPVPRTEGEGNGEWIIVDCGAAVVHVMQPTIRDYYHLEEIWGDKPVNMKIATGTTKLVKAAEPDAPAKKAAAKKAPAAKTPARAPAKTPARAPAKKAPAKGIPVVKKMMIVGKPAAKKKPAAPIGRGVTRTVGVKSAAAKSAPAKKAPAKKAPARKTPGRA
ncbi:MAG: ribosome silencing factor [Burkholderiaceae bacterium]